MTAHSSIPAWKIPWTEEPGGYSPGGHNNRTKRRAKPPPSTLSLELAMTGVLHYFLGR